jgi:hypothetical protein
LNRCQAGTEWFGYSVGSPVQVTVALNQHRFRVRAAVPSGMVFSSINRSSRFIASGVQNALAASICHSQALVRPLGAPMGYGSWVMPAWNAHSGNRSSG